MNLNSSQKGDQLEKIIFDIFSEEIENDRFSVKKQYCRIFRRKGYYSKDREGNIVFDITIEIYMPGQTAYSMLIIIECKNYNHPVPVDDAEEFYGKVEQIAGGNGKAIIASTSAFQKSTHNYCN